MIFEKIREKIEEKAFSVQLKQGIKEPSTFDAMEEKFSVREIKDIINQVEAEYNNGWISVDDRLPEKFDSVLVSCEGCIIGGTHEGEKCEFVATGDMSSKDHWQIQGHSDIKYIKVIAWQPLPEPYVPKGE